MSVTGYTKSGADALLAGKADSDDVATKAQGAKADTAVQPADLDDYAKTADLAAVATSGKYDDLSGTPDIPSTPADIGAATAAQGALADSAVQPAELAAVATSGSYNDLTDKPASTPTAWDDVTGKPAVIAAGATAAAARSEIGAGTSSFDGAYSSLTGTPSLADVATSGAYSDLTGAPAIPDSPDDIGAVPTSRTVNGKALSADVTLDAADVGALPDSTTIPDPTTDAGDLTTGALSIERLPAGSEITVTDDSGTWPDRPTARTDIVVIWRTYNGTAQPDSATPPAVNGAYENDPTNGVMGDFYDHVASS